MTLPVAGVAFTYPVTLRSQLTSKVLSNPTIAAGDFTVSTDGGAFANLATLPFVTPSGSGRVLLSFSAAEMTGASEVLVLARDVSEDTLVDDTTWEAFDVTISLVTGSSETVNDILQGDRIENSVRSRVFKKGTTVNPLLDKKITGSLLTTSVTIGTTDT